jgi:hypothetical protein
MHRGEKLVSRPTFAEIKTDTDKGVSVYKSTEIIQAGAKHWVLRPKNLFILFGTRKNCHDNGINLLFYLFIKKMIKL